MADLDSKASPRLYKHHQRFARYARVRHSKQLYEFLTVQAARLSTTQANIFALLDSFTADQIRAASSLGQL